MLTAFFYAARLYFTLCLQSLRRQNNIGQLTLRGRLLRLLLFVAFLPIWLIHWIGLLLDEILFPGYRKTPIEAPVFILGVPRSGTTFLHRTLSEDSERYTSVATWEVFLAPSIIQRRFWLALATVDRWLGRPGARLLGWAEKKLFRGLEGVHDVSLEAPEEDYLLLLPLLSCFILFLPFPESRHIWQLARFDWEASEKDKRIIMKFYRACLQKHLYVCGKGRRYLSKNAAFASWPQTLHEEFPDARFVVCMREPEKAVPSLLGSLAGGARFFELDLERGEMPRQLTEMMRDYYRHLLTAFPLAAPIVHMHRLRKDIVGTVQSLYTRFGDTMDGDYSKTLLAIETQARGFQTRTRAIRPGDAGDPDFYRERFPWYDKTLTETVPTRKISSNG
ncbi:MAG: sulfotransferase [Pseudohongiellaceae bacterium]